MKEEIYEFEVDLKKSLLTASYTTLSHDDLRGVKTDLDLGG